MRYEEEVKQARLDLAKAQREAANAKRERAKRMEEMVKDPDKWLRETERLVATGEHTPTRQLRRFSLNFARPSEATREWRSRAGRL